MTGSETSAEERDQMNALLDEIDARHDSHLRTEQAEIARIKSTRRDKQLFDIDAFAGIYRLSDLGSSPLISPEIVREYERGYYLRHPEFKTMQQYAEYLRRTDVYDSSGSD